MTSSTAHSDSLRLSRVTCYAWPTYLQSKENSMVVTTELFHHHLQSLSYDDTILLLTAPLAEPSSGARRWQVAARAELKQPTFSSRAIQQHFDQTARHCHVSMLKQIVDAGLQHPRANFGLAMQLMLRILLEERLNAQQRANFIEEHRRGLRLLTWSTIELEPELGVLLCANDLALFWWNDDHFQSSRHYFSNASHQQLFMRAWLQQQHCYEREHFAKLAWNLVLGTDRSDLQRVWPHIDKLLSTSHLAESLTMIAIDLWQISTDWTCLSDNAHLKTLLGALRLCRNLEVLEMQVEMRVIVHTAIEGLGQYVHCIQQSPEKKPQATKEQPVLLLLGRKLMDLLWSLIPQPSVLRSVPASSSDALREHLTFAASRQTVVTDASLIFTPDRLLDNMFKVIAFAMRRFTTMSTTVIQTFPELGETVEHVWTRLSHIIDMALRYTTTDTLAKVIHAEAAIMDGVNPSNIFNALFEAQQSHPREQYCLYLERLLIVSQTVPEIVNALLHSFGSIISHRTGLLTVLRQCTRLMSCVFELVRGRVPELRGNEFIFLSRLFEMGFRDSVCTQALPSTIEDGTLATLIVEHGVLPSFEFERADTALSILLDLETRRPGSIVQPIMQHGNLLLNLASFPPAVIAPSIYTIARILNSCFQHHFLGTATLCTGDPSSIGSIWSTLCLCVSQRLPNDSADFHAALDLCSNMGKQTTLLKQLKFPLRQCKHIATAVEALIKRANPPGKGLNLQQETTKQLLLTVQSGFSSLF